MKKTSYQRLKDKLKESQAETARVRNDFKRSLIDGEFMITQTWRMQFIMEKEFENTIWSGKPTEL